MKKLKSYTDAGKCVAPVDAICKEIKTGAWGCVWDTGSVPTPAPSNNSDKPTPAPSTPGSTNNDVVTEPPTTQPPPTPTPGTTDNDTVTNPPTTTTAPPTTQPTPTTAAPALKGVELSSAGSVASGSHAATGAVAGVVAVGTVAAVAAAVIYKRKSRAAQHRSNELHDVHVDVVTP